MTTWHLDADHIASYRDGQVGSAFAASIETHLVACETCRELVATTADGDRLDRVWADIVDAVDAPAPTASERILRALRVRPDTARLLAATPSLRLSWLTAVAVVLAMASASAHTGRYGLPLFLALAPVLPVARVAASVGRRVDRPRGPPPVRGDSRLAVLTPPTAPVAAIRRDHHHIRADRRRSRAAATT